MVYKVAPIAILLILFSVRSFSQIAPSDSLKAEILKLDGRVKQIELNLEQSQRKFQSGIFIATLGYATTIAGGLMLGRENDELGQVLLVAGGTTGIIGTYKMVDAFRFLTGKKRKKKNKG